MSAPWLPVSKGRTLRGSRANLGGRMPRLVNLDAMIPREDFEVDERDGAAASAQRLGKELKLSELESAGITYNSLRKPDFQRETADWEAAKVADFIKSFVDGDLIPAIIMWRSPKTGNLFVIDGAHRLGALIAWIHDDYGDAVLSRPFFQNMIEAPQQKAADETRQKVATELGTYQQLKQYALRPESAPNELSLRRGRNMGAFTIDLQWVDGDAQTAESSFFKINQSASRIAETELALIKARRKPNAIATRALIRAGTGHKYWSSIRSGREGRDREGVQDGLRQSVPPRARIPHQDLGPVRCRPGLHGEQRRDDLRPSQLCEWRPRDRAGRRCHRESPPSSC